MVFYWKNRLLHACNDEHKVNWNDNNWLCTEQKSKDSLKSKKELQLLGKKKI